MPAKIPPHKVLQIRRLRRYGVSIVKIAQQTGISRWTVRKYCGAPDSRAIKNIALESWIDKAYLDALPQALAKTDCPACGESIVVIRSQVHARCVCGNVWTL